MNDLSHISLGKRLRSCSSFRCLGVRPNWEDYSSEDAEAIDNARVIFYPSPLYEDIFRALGKAVVPETYSKFVGNKIRQTNLFQLLEIPHPRTRLYSGRNRIARICGDFEYPFIAKTPVGSSRGEGVHLIENREELARYLECHQPAYIQEYLPIDRDLRAVVIRGRVVHAYWRIHPPGDFRNNVAQGAQIAFDSIPREALDFAEEVADRCHFDDVGLDICHVHGGYLILEANMAYGLEGFHRKGLDMHGILEEMDRKGELWEPDSGWG